VRGTNAELGASPQFHRWVTAEQEQNAVAAYERLRQAKEAEPEKRVQISRMLLEVGHPNEVLVALNDILPRGDESVDLRLLRSAAYAATGDYQNAIEQCDVSLKRDEKGAKRIACSIMNGTASRSSSRTA
jgi:hypothetical protein